MTEADALLFESFLDGEMTDQEGESLLRNFQESSALRKEMLLHLGMAQLLEKNLRPDRELLEQRIFSAIEAIETHDLEWIQDLPRQNKKSRMRYVLWAALPVAALLVIGLMIRTLLLPVGPLEIIDYKGKIAWGENSDELNVRERYTIPQTIQLSDDARLVFEYPDKTRIQLGGNTVLRWGQNERQLFLDQGELQADVMRYHDGTALDVITPHARAIIKGTSFVLRADSDSSLLQVRHGRVLFEKGGKELEAQPGGALIADANGIQDLGGLGESQLDLVQGKVLFSDDFSKPHPNLKRWGNFTQQDLPQGSVKGMLGRPYEKGYPFQSDDISWQSEKYPLFVAKDNCILNITLKAEPRTFRITLAPMSEAYHRSRSVYKKVQAEGWHTISIPIDEIPFVLREDEDSFSELSPDPVPYRELTIHAMDHEHLLIDRVWVTQTNRY